MENASKALIIAGAILLAILLISLGILVYTQASSTINDTKIDTEAIQTFNKKITQYCGEKKSSSQAKALIAAVAASNGAQSKLANKHYIAVTVHGSGIIGQAVTKTTLESASDDTQISYPSFHDNYVYNLSYSTDANGYVYTVDVNGKEN